MSLGSILSSVLLCLLLSPCGHRMAQLTDGGLAAHFFKLRLSN